MEALKEKKAEHKQRFYDWLSNSNDAENSTILTNEKYDQTKKCLQGKITPDQDFKRRIERQKFQLVNHEGLGLQDVICVPTEGGKVSLKKTFKRLNMVFPDYMTSIRKLDNKIMF